MAANGAEIVGNKEAFWPILLATRSRADYMGQWVIGHIGHSIGMDHFWCGLWWPVIMSTKCVENFIMISISRPQTHTQQHVYLEIVVAISITAKGTQKVTACWMHIGSYTAA